MIKLAQLLKEAIAKKDYIGVATYGAVVGDVDKGWDEPHGAHGFGGRGRDRWRYDAATNTVYWSDGRGTIENRSAVEVWLAQHGIQTNRHDTILNAPRIRFELEFEPEDPLDPNSPAR